MSRFQLPSLSLPQARIDAANLLAGANETFDKTFAKWQADYKAFWYESDGVTLKSAASLNAILDEMDAVAPAQTARLFQISYATAHLLLACDPTCLTESDYLPPKPYSVDPVTFHITVTD